MTETTPNERTSAPRWWQRVVPVAGLGLAAVAVAAYALPDDQVALSTSRAPQPFVELFLATRADNVCSPDVAQVRFRMQSHLERQRALRYTIALDPAGGGDAARESGKLRLDPGEAKSRWVRLAAPSDSYTVTVSLKDRPETLRVHCPGGRS